jgi:Flp pilus assembly protein TadG
MGARGVTIMRSRKNQRGQAMLESALIMLVFLPVLIGIMDFGQLLYFSPGPERAYPGCRALGR